MYIPKYLRLYEVLPQDFYNKHLGLGNTLWNLFDNRVLWTADQIREIYGPIIANTWYIEELVEKYGRHEYRGWRPFDCSVGALLSQHKFGRGFDCIFRDVKAEQVREDIKNKKYDIFRYITTIEDKVSWLHFDTRNWNKERNGLLVIQP